MRISDLASSPPVTCRPQAPLRQLLNLMAEHDVGAVAVVDDDDRLVGIVTDRDVALRAYARQLDLDAAVTAVMTADPVAVAADADIEAALDQFAARGSRRLPVVDEAGRVVGMVTLDDLILQGTSQLERIAGAVRTQAHPGTHRRQTELDHRGEHRQT